jgi:predicted anti-sigma-YlaC factor YlaD
MLTCREFDEFMVDYLDGELPVWQKYVCWLHVKMCKECAYFVQQYRRTLALEKSAFASPEDVVPDSVPEDLVRAAIARRNKKHN